MAVNSACSVLKGFSRLSLQALRNGALNQLNVCAKRCSSYSPRSSTTAQLLRISPLLLQQSHRDGLSSDSHRFKPPKKPLSSYFLFKKDHYPDVVRNNPGVDVVHISKQISQMWRNLPHDERLKYMAAAEEERIRYKEFIDSLSPEEQQGIKSQAKERRKKLQTFRQKKKLKELNRPKRPPNQYNLYTQERLKFRGTTPPRDYMREVAQEWNKMSNEEKKPYAEKAKEIRAQYKEAMLEWEKQMKAEGHPEVVRGYRRPRAPRPRKAAKKKTKKPRKKAAKKTSAKKTTEKKSTKKNVEPEDVSWMREE